jgi:small-conductance mechanosensitive channel
MKVLFKKYAVWFLLRLAALIVLLAIVEIVYNTGTLAIFGPSNVQILIYSVLQKIVLSLFVWFGLAIAIKIVIPTIVVAASPALTRMIREPAARTNASRSVSRYLTYIIYLFAILAIIYVWAYSFIGTYIAGVLGTGLIVALTFVLGLFTSSVLGNILAYVVLDGTTEFKTGDRVQIGEDYGDIVELGFFFTRVKTIKDEVISIPNLAIINKEIKNFSGLKTVQIYIPVTLGYDIDKEEAKKQLIKCAEMTNGLILDDPDKKPYVLFRDLGNYTITYEINAYTDKPNRLINIKSDLIDNILTEFKKANMEILSPTHIVVRRHPDALEEPKNSQRNISN